MNMIHYMSHEYNILSLRSIVDLSPQPASQPSQPSQPAWSISTQFRPNAVDFTQNFDVHRGARGGEPPNFFGPDLQVVLSTEIWNFGLEPSLPAGPGRAARPDRARDRPKFQTQTTKKWI